MNSTLDKEQIIKKALEIATRGWTKDPMTAIDLLALNETSITDDKDQIEQIEMIISLGGAELVEESNNQHSFTSVYRIGDREYIFSSFEYGDVEVTERLIITHQDFES